MEVGDGGDIPGVTGQGARAEAARVVGEMGYDHSHDLRGMPGGGGGGGRGGLRRSAFGTHPLNSNLTSIPNHFEDKLDHYDGGHDWNGEKWVVYLPDNEDVGVFLGGIVSLLQGRIFCLGGWVLVELPWETAHGSNFGATVVGPGDLRPLIDDHALAFFFEPPFVERGNLRTNSMSYR